jgi:hypothetical protein
MRKRKNTSLHAEQRAALLETLMLRFNANMRRHPGLEWQPIHDRLKSNPEKLWSLHEMERTGGEPDVIGYDSDSDSYIFCDCSPESPGGRRSACYDREAQQSRKEHAPEHNAVDLAAAMGIELLTEEEYHTLQTIGPFDMKTSSWLKTPPELRALGGAIFGDYRYGRVFIYHNGAQSYYAARAFRAMLSV